MRSASRLCARGFAPPCSPKRRLRRYARDKPRFGEHLEAIKFLCKEFWSEVFKKQVDNLKTNYRGVYVLTDNRFRWLHRFAGAPPGGAGVAEAIARQLHLPCGVLCGALAGLGVQAVVTAEAGVAPACAWPACSQHVPASLGLLRSACVALVHLTRARRLSRV